MDMGSHMEGIREYIGSKGSRNYIACVVYSGSIGYEELLELLEDVDRLILLRGTDGLTYIYLVSIGWNRRVMRGNLANAFDLINSRLQVRPVMIRPEERLFRRVDEEVGGVEISM